MRSQAESIQDSAPGVTPSAPWRVREVQALAGYRLSVKFNDGVSGEVDLSRVVLSDKAGIFATLRDPAVFNRVHVECGVVTWPGEIDLAPDAMHEEIKKQGRWVLD